MPLLACVSWRWQAERRMFDAIYYVPMHEALFPITDKVLPASTQITAVSQASEFM